MGCGPLGREGAGEDLSELTSRSLQKDMRLLTLGDFGGLCPAIALFCETERGADGIEALKRRLR